LPAQNLKWITGIVTRFDFGYSFHYNRPVGDVIAQRLPRTQLLAQTSHMLATRLGLKLGNVAATRQKSIVDTVL
jgi:peptide/nickel transport system permease protein